MQKKEICQPAFSLSKNNYSIFKENNISVDNETRDLRLPQKIALDIRNLIRVIVLLTSDILAISCAWHLANTSYLQNLWLSSEQIKEQTDLSFLSVLILGVCLLSVCQAYTRGAKSRNLINSSKAISLAYLVLTPTAWEYYHQHGFSVVFVAWLLTIVLANIGRLIIFQAIAYLRSKYPPLQIKVMLIGEGEDIAKCLPLLEKSREFQIGAQLDISKFEQGDFDTAQGGNQQLLNVLEELNSQQIGEVLVCSWGKIKNSKKFLWKLRGSGVYWRILELDKDFSLPNWEISHQFEGINTLRISDPPIMGINFLSKRIFDILASLMLLAVLSLPMIIIAVLIKLDSPGSVFYRQTRVGLQGNHFKVWKFRTMVKNASQLQKELEAQNEINGGILFKIKNDPRITRVGKYLRQYSLDELPQLFNVLGGEMSLVGPRPLPIRDVENFSPEHYFRHEVLPGITGLWQVSGRSDIDSENAFNLDFEYIQNWSLALDFKILVRTVGVVLNRKGAY